MTSILKKQAGDTIVEVLIAMAVVSLVLAGAYTMTNRNTRSTLDAQEHGQALKLVETQIEFLRAAAHGNTTYNFGSSNQCFDNTGVVIATASAAACNQQSDGSAAVANQVPTYYMTIVAPPVPNPAKVPYAISAVWDTAAGITSRDGNVTLYYRPN